MRAAGYWIAFVLLCPAMLAGAVWVERRVAALLGDHLAASVLVALATIVLVGALPEPASGRDAAR